jgi:exonuclease SbcC
VRPIRREIEAVTAYRDRTVVDLADADLFALVGPTGAGKSSVIDAMVFALYGTVPRYGDARLVGSVINQRSARALVDFQFAVGNRMYRIVREVSRQKRGGSPREARLEDADTGDSLVDGDARQLTAAVERILGLTRDQFTKCVVLPQGEFQRFLHDKPGQRQDLLVQLLGAEVYGRIGERARQEQKAGSARVQVLDDQCAAFEVQLAEEPALRGQLAALTRLQTVVDELLPILEDAAGEESVLGERLDRIDDRLSRLRAIARPDGLDDVAEAVADLDEELEALRRDEGLHAAHEREVEAALSELPTRADLLAAIDRQRRRAELSERIAKGETLVDEARGDQRDAEVAAETAAAALRQAENEVERVRREHAAAHLAADLGTGDDCPVCHRRLAAPPIHDAADLSESESTVSEARRHLDQSGSRRDETRATHGRYVSQLDLLREQVAELGPTTDDLPAAEVEARLALVAAAEEAVTAARLARRTVAERREVSERKRNKVAKIETAAWDEFDVARDRVAVLEPPKATRRDLARAWSELDEWADTRRLELEAQRGETSAARLEVDQRRRASNDALTDAFAAAGLDRPDQGAREMVAARRARNEAEIERLTQVRDDLARLVSDRRAATESEQVAGELGNLLRSNAFEKWLLDAAMSALVAGASVKLEELSRGQYGMAVDARSGGFLVVDHHDVDEQRPARTLSGGETFLASLALALALAEQVADLAADAAPKIESIFLDEGFGTLDPDTLEVVVAAIEELQAGGLVVGLVSHVVELAERVPTRFEVRKGPGGSTVERIDR